MRSNFAVMLIGTLQIQAHMVTQQMSPTREPGRHVQCTLILMILREFHPVSKSRVITFYNEIRGSFLLSFSYQKAVSNPLCIFYWVFPFSLIFPPIFILYLSKKQFKLLVALGF
uniref:Uncharacterized protein n=1 Tax=Sulfolobus neozealandicus TaxID=299422 RepID=Q5DVF6_9CREN|nr:hypothetical protein [Sulfolobus neozealandicus]